MADTSTSPVSVNRVPEDSQSQSRRKRRAAVACSFCHARKVRCNVAFAGPPCANCIQDGVDCILHVSGRGKYKRTKASKNATSLSAEIAASSEHSGDQSFGFPLYPSLEPGSSGDIDIAGEPPAEQELIEDTGENGEAFRNLVELNKVQEPAVPFFTGESQGLRFIFNVSKEHVLASSSHLRVPRSERNRLAPEELAFLTAKGAFSLPPIELRDELISCYFDYFIGKDILKRSGIPSTKALKRQLYQRAKALYDLDYEKDKIPLIQAVLLMGYWYVDTYDRTNSWHWIGIASSLAQTIGLHREPVGGNIPDSHRRLWKRVWWCCFHRDRWIALGMGRPVRIHPDDCDTQVLTTPDLVDADLSPGLSDRARGIVASCNTLAPIFIELVKLSVHLGAVLNCSYSAIQSTPAKIRHCDEELTSWYNNLDPHFRVDLSATSGSSSSLIMFHKHVVHVFFQVIVIHLHRPVIFRSFQPNLDLETKRLPEEAREKCVVAAFAATESLRRLISLDQIKVLPPESVSAVIAITAIHFLERYWTKGLSRQSACQNLDLTLMILRELSDRYWAAYFVLTFFKAAFKKIDSAFHASRAHSPAPGHQTPARSATPPPVPNDDFLFSPNSSDFAGYMDMQSPGTMINDINALLETGDLLNDLNGYLWRNDDPLFNQSPYTQTNANQQ